MIFKPDRIEAVSLHFANGVDQFGPEFMLGSGHTGRFHHISFLEHPVPGTDPPEDHIFSIPVHNSLSIRMQKALGTDY